jgi:hypothetical protein
VAEGSQALIASVVSAPGDGRTPVEEAAGQPVLQAAAAEDSRAPAEFYALTLSTCSNQSLIGTQQIAWLHFTAVSNQSSAFVSLKLDNTVGQQPDGAEVRNFAPQAGRVVVVGEEPLLEAILATNRQPALILYGKPGPDYVIQGKPRLDPALPWQVVWQGTQTNLFQQIQPIGGTNRMMFFRAKRAVSASTALRLEAALGADGRAQLSLFGLPGSAVRLETSNGLTNDWTFWRDVTLSGPSTNVSPAPLNGRTLFIRARRL